MSVDKIAADLRKWLKAAGVNRAKLYERNEDRLRLRAHDLRSTFVTLSLANDKTEDWVRTRTGHLTTTMIALYRQEASTYAELGLGQLNPLHEAIPELRDMAPAEVPDGDPDGGDLDAPTEPRWVIDQGGKKRVIG